MPSEGEKKYFDVDKLYFEGIFPTWATEILKEHLFDFCDVLSHRPVVMGQVTASQDLSQAQHFSVLEYIDNFHNSKVL